jgi:uncharacterized RDD family membrane protein YckC
MGKGMYAGFWRRFVACAADLLLLALIYVLMSAMPLEPEPRPHVLAGGLYAVIVAWLYFAGMESSTEQATLGKMLMGIRVADSEGERIGFPRATGRHFAKIISALIFYAGFIMIGMTERKQGLHDRLAGTVLLQGRAQMGRQAAAVAQAPAPFAGVAGEHAGGRPGPGGGMAPSA